MYSIRLADGTVIDNLELNGNNFIAQHSVDESVFTKANLLDVTITGDGKEEHRINQVMCNFWVANDGTHIILRDRTAEERLKDELDAKIEYIAMMSDIDL